jgi:ABC-type antimicrobial peptide transport system permease subunit
VSQSGAGVVLRAGSEPLELVPFVRSTLRDLQPHAALEHEAALADRIWASTAEPRFYATVMGVFATLALVTALVGLFGVLSYIVERRRVEIGLRRALGATGANISALVLGKGIRLVGLAVPIGFAGAIAGVGLLRNLLFGIGPADLATFAAVLVGVPVVALAACVWPARRASRIEPLDALREN